ncbi:MAG: hypothetical protein U0169_04970 [Polyangiaceae bacterium]
MKIPSSPLVFLVASTAALLVTACSSTANEANGAAVGTGPQIPAANVGTYCSGVGTSPGDAASFTEKTCPAGLCVADARKDFATYCSADCTSNACPKGYACETLKLGDVPHVCLRDGTPLDDTAPSTPATGSTNADAGTGAPVTTKPQPLGTKGDANADGTIDVDVSARGSHRCMDECVTAGGECTYGANGSGFVTRVEPNGQVTGYQLTCTDRENDQAPTSTKIKAMTCYCKNLPPAPEVRVTNLTDRPSCAAVCESWDMTCSAKRPSAEYGSADASKRTALSCTAQPSATADHVICACET